MVRHVSRFRTAKIGVKDSQKWSRARSEKDVDVDAKVKLVEAHWRRKDHPSLG